MVGGLRGRREEREDGKAAALAELMRLKRSGMKQSSVYEIEEADPVYDEVDEATYAAMAQRKRKEAREFLTKDDVEGDDVVEGSSGGEDLEEDFAWEDEISKIWEEGGDQPRKRKVPGSGLGAKRRKKRDPAPQKVPSVFLRRSDPDKVRGSKPDDTGPSVVDQLLETEMETGKAKEKAGKRKTDSPFEVDDILFGGASIRELQVAQGAEGDRAFVDQSVAEPATKPKLELPEDSRDVASDSLQSVRSEEQERERGMLKMEKDHEIRAVDLPIPRQVPCRPEEVPQVLARTSDGDIMMYWLDAFEVKVRQGQDLYLFGKVPLGEITSGVFANVCVRVDGLERMMFFLPRENHVDESGNQLDRPVSIVPDLHEEVTQMLFKTSDVSAVKAKVVERSCPFGDPVAPGEPVKYLKVKYPYRFGSLPATLTGRCFSRVVGANTSPLERLLVKREILGPSWLCLRNPTILIEKITHCQFALSVECPKHVMVARNQLDPPHITALTISVKCAKSDASDSAEIFMVSGIMSRGLSVNIPLDQDRIDFDSRRETFHVLRTVNRRAVPLGFQDKCRRDGINLHLVSNEAALLNCTMGKISQLDPDVIIGHELLEVGLQTTLARTVELKLPNWSRLGRLVQKRDISSQLAKATSQGAHGLSGWMSNLVADACAGRLLCDTYLNAKDLLPREKDYSISALANSILGWDVRPITDPKKVDACFDSADSLKELISENIWIGKTSLSLAANLSLLPLTKQLTTLSGNTWSRTLGGARAERIEFLLCHELKHARPKLLLPDKLMKSDRQKLFGLESKSDKGKRKPQYAGGLVLEPRRGLYDNYTLQLDFNSLYPSIIQEFNICFTTVNLPCGSTGTSASVELPDPSVPEGILPGVLRRLVEKRRAVKSALRSETDPVKAKQLEIRQLAIKLTANSIYGCLGFENSRFFARPMAELITFQGRDILQRTVDIARETFNAQVIYGDTDSVFVYTGLSDLEKVRTLGIDIKKEVNRRYRTLEIEVDAIYAKILLLKKKKYAALKVKNPMDPTSLVREVKGLDMVRHDWSDISREVSEFALKQILTPEIGIDDALGCLMQYMTAVAKRVREGNVPLTKYVITKSITKNPEDYPDAQNLPHVQVALRRKSDGRAVRAGDYIKYIICSSTAPNGPKDTLAMRAFHPEEISTSQGNLIVDAEWYLEHQIFPPITRLCEPIEGVDNARLATVLGLDAKKYEERVGPSDHLDEQEAMSKALASDEEKYRDCEKLLIPCRSCGLKEFVGDLYCASCGGDYVVAVILNRITAVVREWVRKYYCSSLERNADDGTIQRTRNVTLHNGRGKLRRSNESSEIWLYTQLRYLMWVIDPKCSQGEKQLTSSPSRLPRQRRESLRILSAHVNKIFDRNGFRFVRLASFLPN